MGAWETVKRVAKETWSQKWFRWGVFAGILVIAIFLPMASKNPDGLERVAENLALMSDLLGISSFLPIYTYTVTFAPFPDYYIPQLYPIIIYELYYSSYIEIPQTVLYKLGEMYSSTEYISSLLAGIVGFLITLGAAWLVGLVLKKKEPST